MLMFSSCVKENVFKHFSRPMPDCLQPAERRAEEMFADI